MSHDAALALWALLAFEIKHFLCDFVLQTEYQVRTKGIYGHVGGFIHSGLHAVLTVPALIILGASIKTIGIVMIVEFAIHYHTDWLKAQIDQKYQWGFSDQRYWILFGADQLIHQLTYLGIVYAFLTGLLA